MKRISGFHRVLAFALASALMTACGGGGGSSGTTPPTPAPTVTPTATSTPGGGGSFNQADFTCPSSDGTLAVTAGNPRGAGDSTRLPVRRGSTMGLKYAPNLLAVTYSTGMLTASRNVVADREIKLGAHEMREMQFDHLGTTTRIVSVDPSKAQSVAALLRAQQGVRSVAQVGLRRPLKVSQPYITNDDYFKGFTGTSAPLYETATIPGQWDMHILGLENAFAYSQAGDVPSGVTANPNALGNPSVRIAIVDTGEDTLHPELAGKVTYQKCYITNPNNQQSTSNFTNDPDGHGTDVSGIAASKTNNAFGFTAAGGNVSLMGYRVFPTPVSFATCSDPNTNDPSCSASTADIAAAINDAVANHANVISMSLGGGSCTGGTDDDPTEGAAIANAIAAKVVVVAASGNSAPTSGIMAPACDTGVIAVGATSLDDGQATGRGAGQGTAANPLEYVASYSQYGSPGSAPKSASAWGIVAPGGDPAPSETCSTCTTIDDLHWIENIWTQTPYDTTNDAGECTQDYPNSSSTTPPVDCRTDIAGTSMATPHVSGVAALIISVNPTYQDPTQMKALLCTTADDIGDSKEGCGRLNAYRAMAKAMNDPTPP